MPEQPELVRFGPYEGRLVETACPICPAPPPPRLVWASRRGVRYLRCPGCSLLYASPRFDERSLRGIYENESFSDLERFRGWTLERFEAEGGRNWHVCRLKAGLIAARLPPGSRVLDVGCATGELCALLAGRGFDCEGVDISERLTRIARSVVGVTAHALDLAAFAPARPFRGAVVWDVLEHLADPVGLLRECRRVLEPGGLVFAQVPNSAGLGNRFKALRCRVGLGRDFHHFGFPYHLAFYDRASLGALFVAAGFRPVHFESWSHLLKDGRDGPMARAIAGLVRRACLSDYIVGLAAVPAP